MGLIHVRMDGTEALSEVENLAFDSVGVAFDSIGTAFDSIGTAFDSVGTAFDSIGAASDVVKPKVFHLTRG